MAVAFTKVISDISLDAGVRKVTIDLTYVGADVPGTLTNETIVVDISTVTTVPLLMTALHAAVRARALALGFTVPANQSWLPSYAAG